MLASCAARAQPRAKLVQSIGMSHGSHIMRRQAIVLAAALAMAPLGARAADLVVWWEKGFYPQETKRSRRSSPPSSRRPASRSSWSYSHRMSYSTRLRRPSGPGSRPTSCSAPPAKAGPRVGLRGSARRPRRRPRAGPRSVRCRRHRGVHVAQRQHGQARPLRPADGPDFQSLPCLEHLLERAGFTLDDIPKEWGPFWSFWCDRVQPAVRKALGREDIWGVGLPMSAAAVSDTATNSTQFQLAYKAHLARPRPAGRRSTIPTIRAEDHQGAGRLHPDLAQGLHAARLDELGQPRTTTRHSSPRPL